jgi:hypothetical protein
LVNGYRFKPSQKTTSCPIVVADANIKMAFSRLWKKLVQQQLINQDALFIRIVFLLGNGEESAFQFAHCGKNQTSGSKRSIKKIA